MEVGLLPSLGLVSSDGVGIRTVSMNPLVVPDTYIYRGVRNCLMVKNGSKYHVFLAHMEYLEEPGWKYCPLEFQTS